MELDNRQMLDIFTEASDAEESGNFSTAIRLYKALVDLNFTPAMINLGNIYDDYLNPPQPENAVDLYEKAFRLGVADAAYNLAIHYKKAGQFLLEKIWMEKYESMDNE